MSSNLNCNRIKIGRKFSPVLDGIKTSVLYIVKLIGDVSGPPLGLSVDSSQPIQIIAL